MKHLSAITIATLLISIVSMANSCSPPEQVDADEHTEKVERKAAEENKAGNEPAQTNQLVEAIDTAIEKIDRHIAQLKTETTERGKELETELNALKVRGQVLREELERTANKTETEVERLVEETRAYMKKIEEKLNDKD
ncbi:MAG: hypothetical protein Kow0075_17430 [Salibacteraceae bacterium]